jgi:PKD repeat protein
MRYANRITSTLILILLVTITIIIVYTWTQDNSTANQNTNPTEGPNTHTDNTEVTCESDLPPITSPFASFYVVPSFPTINQPVRFLDASSPGQGMISNWSWSFGDGHTSISASPRYVYDTTGDKNVSLTIISVDGKMSTVSRIIHVSTESGYEAPYVDFTFSPENPYIGQTITFTQTFANDSTIATQSYWDFGDGTTSNGLSPTHVYSASGQKTVTLTVTDSAHEVSTVTHTITINDPIPAIASFTYSPTEPTVAVIVEFRCTTTVGSGTVNHFNWDFGDGQTSTSHHPTHTYTTSGEKTVSLRVTDVFGISSTSTQTIYVSAG